MRIGIYTAYNLSKIEFSYHNGSYLIHGDTTSFGAILPNEFVSINHSKDGKVELRHGVKYLGKFKKVTLTPTGKSFALRLDPKSSNIHGRRYLDGFEIFANKKGLSIVNVIDMDNYLMGVVESEGGGGKHLEYYKAQAVISRTYALKHQHKHKKDGYQLCDQVHCQAYHNMMRFTPTIEAAVKATSGEFMVDTVSNNLVDGYFHANCGGQTSKADYVWNVDVPYLQPFKDTFCIHTVQATWTKRIPKTEWRNYLVNNFHYPIQDSLYREMIYTFEQDERKAFFLSPQLGIPLRDIRYQFKLRSTFFSCYPDGEDVVLEGKGYGHGIGMCQEGAMGMANQGLDYVQILSYYFDGIRIENKMRAIFYDQKVSNPFDF